MTEAYLHFLWKLKRLPFHLFETTEGKAIHILNNGIHNLSESGPDFSNARIFYDELEWAGQIEIHIKSSDWYAHKHQEDDAYKNVILHVVYQHDKDVLINGKAIPTIELKSFIDETHYAKWKEFEMAIQDIACENSIATIDPIFVKAMIHRAANDRLYRKVNQLLYEHSHLDNQSMLYHLLARAFGSKINALPFELLTNQLPLSLLKRMQVAAQNRVLLQSSGLFAEIEMDRPEIPVLPRSIWKRKGLRPHSFPEKRLLQFAHFVSSCDFELLAEHLSPKEAYDYLVALLREQDSTYQISNQMLNHLLINALLPYFWLKSVREENENLQEFVLSFLQELEPENNFIIKKWKKIGVSAANAYESQALIELYNEYCSRKKCLHCQVGVKILKG